MSLEKEAINIHKKLKGKIELKTKVKLSKKNLKLLYTPGVAIACNKIKKNKSLSYEYTNRANSIAIISDGTSILGLGNIGPEAGMPVMEGKSLLYKELADIDAYPLCLNINPENITSFVKAIAPSFAGIHFEDISVPHCFELLEKLKNLGIPVFNDDIHGTAIVVLAALKNALKLVKKSLTKSKIVILGFGAAGIGIAELLHKAKAKNILAVDSKGIIYRGRKKHMNKYKHKFASMINPKKIKGSMDKAIKNADVIIGVSGIKGLLKASHIKSMNSSPIVFALSNPFPEITPKQAYKAGATIVATGSSLYKNQVNNVKAFPAFFRGLLDGKAKKINNKIYLAAANSLAKQIKKPDKFNIIPNVNKNTTKNIANSIKKEVIKLKLQR